MNPSDLDHTNLTDVAKSDLSPEDKISLLLDRVALLEAFLFDRGYTPAVGREIGREFE